MTDSICTYCQALLQKLADPHERAALVDAVIPHEALQNVPELREAAQQYANLLEAGARKVVAKALYTALCRAQNTATT